MNTNNIPEYYADGLPIMQGDVVSKIIATSIFYDADTKEQKKIARVQIVIPNEVLLSLCFNVLNDIEEFSPITDELKSKLRELNVSLEAICSSNVNTKE